MVVTPTQIYASVDLELTGFDPLIDEIVEIGIVRFQLVDGAFTIIDEWNTLIRPSKALHNRIQGLTGIQSADLDSAPIWSEVGEKVATMLADTVLVGHGVELDKKFLEVQGVQFRKGVIDTLELAQIFLPTHHSYNLENLANLLQVSHGHAHRALSDAYATVGVLESLVGIFNQLPEPFHGKVERIARIRHSVWHGLFTTATKAKSATIADDSTSDGIGFLQDFSVAGPKSALVHVSHVYNVPWQSLAESGNSWVVAFPAREQVLSVARRGLAVPFLGVAEALSHRAVTMAEEFPEQLSDREALALEKILVWQAGARTKQSVLAEINWSLLGTEYKKRFSEIRSFPKGEPIVAVDYRSLPDIPPGSNIWLCAADSYIDWLEQNSGQVVSWHSIVHTFRQIYNPETGAGDARKAPAVQEAIAATDVLFASVLLLLKKDTRIAHGVVSYSDISPYAYDRIIHAIENYKKKLERLSSIFEEKIVQRMLGGIDALLRPMSVEHEELRWIEVGDARCAFIVRPLRLTEGIAAVLGKAQQVYYASDMPPGKCIQYMQKRLELPLDFPLISHRSPSDAVSYKVAPTAINTYLSEGLPGGADTSRAYVFPNLPLLKEFYDGVYPKLTEKKSVIAVGVHGGVNKVLRNLSFSSKTSILISQQSLAGYYAMALPICEIFFMGLPEIQGQHPFTRALLHKYFPTSDEGEAIFASIKIMQAIRQCVSANLPCQVVFAVSPEEYAAAQQVFACVSSTL